MKETKTGRERNRQVNPQAGRLAAEKRERGFVKTTADDTYCMLLNENENDHFNFFSKINIYNCGGYNCFGSISVVRVTTFSSQTCRARLRLPVAADFSV